MKQSEDKFDAQLQTALCRQSPPDDFADRVLARIAELPQAERPMKRESWGKRLIHSFRLLPFQWSPPQWAAVGALAALLIIAVVAFNQHQRQQQRALELAEGQQAKEQVMLAMRIASKKLNVAQRKVQESSER